jgi:hypothetical protein
LCFTKAAWSLSELESRRATACVFVAVCPASGLESPGFTFLFEEEEAEVKEELRPKGRGLFRFKLPSSFGCVNNSCTGNDEDDAAGDELDETDDVIKILIFRLLIIICYFLFINK